MTMEYSRLTLTERKLIEQHIKTGKTQTWIAKSLGRNKSTISREVHRGGFPPHKYMYHRAERHSVLCKQRNRRKAKIQGKLKTVILYYLFEWNCSPQQISGRLKRELPNHPEMHVSPETIYRYIYSSPLKEQITSSLRRKRKKRRRKQKLKRGGI
jgi:transposase, IS30 family